MTLSAETKTVVGGGGREGEEGGRKGRPTFQEQGIDGKDFLRQRLCTGAAFQLAAGR